MTQIYTGNPDNPDSPSGRWVCDQDGLEFTTIGEVERHLLSNPNHACTFKIAGSAWPA